MLGYVILKLFLFCFPFSLSPLPWRCGPTWAMISFFRFLDHPQRFTTVGMTPLDEWSAHRKYLYLTTFTRDKHPCPGGIRIQNSSKRAALDPRLRPSYQWDRLAFHLSVWVWDFSKIRRFAEFVFWNFTLPLDVCVFHQFLRYQYFNRCFGKYMYFHNNAPTLG